MVLERAELLINPGHEEAFAAAMRDHGNAYLEQCGCRNVRVLRGVENPDKFIILGEWESVDAHVSARSLEAFGKFRELIAPHTGRGGSMEHFALD
ncbi:MAG: antibiotic biosynthesis monooxygenase [Novosphingobium sp.]|nr:antibiotic biosynthesis monooxygenase [Novosphingobium sp.]